MVNQATILWYAYTLAATCAGLLIQRVFEGFSSYVLLLIAAIVSALLLGYYQLFVLPRLEAFGSGN